MGGLWRQTIDVARERGYDAIAAQATTDATRRVLGDELGFSPVAAVSYADFVVPADERADGSYSGAIFAELVDKNPAQFGGGLSVHLRKVPSNLYV